MAATLEPLSDTNYEEFDNEYDYDDDEYDESEVDEPKLPLKKRIKMKLRSIEIRKQTTYLIEGLARIQEYWIIGILHQIAISTDIYSGDEFSASIGYLFSLLFGLFYTARLVGSIVGCTFALRKRTMLITYIFLAMILLFTFLQYFSGDVYWLVLCRICIGWGSGLVPLASFMRIELFHNEVAA